MKKNEAIEIINQIFPCVKTWENVMTILKIAKSTEVKSNFHLDESKWEETILKALKSKKSMVSSHLVSQVARSEDGKQKAMALIESLCERGMVSKKISKHPINGREFVTFSHKTNFPLDTLSLCE